MPRRRKAFPCGHAGFGQFCHPCRDKETTLEVRRQEKAAKAAVLDVSPIPLDGLPASVQTKAFEVMEAVAAGRPWQDFGRGTPPPSRPPATPSGRRRA